MTKPLTHSELESLISIMNRMLVEANSSNWQALNRLDSERRVILQYKDKLNQSTPASENYSDDQRLLQTASVTNQAGVDSIGNGDNQQAPNYRELVAKVIELDRILISTAQEARQDLLLKKRQNANQFKAKQGYAKAILLRTSHG